MKTEASEYLSLLQEIQNNNVSTFTVMPADEPRFTIETNSRNIIVPSEFSFLSVQNDHRAETIYFEIDRYFDNVDLSQHACVVQFINKSGTTINEGTYPVTSMDIDSVDGKIVFGWEIRNDATQLTGDITFSVRFYSIDNNGNFTYNFNTLTASSYILPSLNIIASGERITATELEVWTDKMNNLASSIESDIITVEEKIEELENYIASIPEDYTALTEEVSQLSGEIVELVETGKLTTEIENIDIEQGALNADGRKASSQAQNRLRTVKAYKIPVGTEIKAKSGYEFNPCLYTQSVENESNFISTPNKYMSSYTVSIDCFYGITMRKADNSDVSVTEVTINDILDIKRDNDKYLYVDGNNIANFSVCERHLSPILSRKTQRNYIHLSFDDVESCFKDLAEHISTYTSIFDCSFFSFLKEMHEKYGAKFSLYCFTLTDSATAIGTKFADDFISNSNWLKFGFHSYAQGKNKSGYDAFINDIFALGMTSDSIDRLPRLDGYSCSLVNVKEIRDTDCGIVGLLSSDDNRASYYFSDNQNSYIRANGKLVDYTNGLICYSTNFRLDWFNSNFTSQYEYNAPIKINPYDELVYRMKDKTVGKLYAPIIVFTHEWEIFSNTYVLDSKKSRIEDVCRFAYDYNLEFDYPMIRENYGISPLSV